MSLATLVDRAHLPLAAVLIVAGIGLAAGSRDLMKRLLGASVAMIAAIVHLAVIAGEGQTGAVLAAAVLAFAASALGLIVLVRIREGFASIDARAVRAGIEEDAAQAAREA